METRKSVRNARGRRLRRPARSQEGTAMIIALAVMGLLAIFVAASLSRVSTEMRISANEKAIANSYFVAQASLEHMSRNFTRLYKKKIALTDDDITDIKTNKPADFTTDYEITQSFSQVGGSLQTTVAPGSAFAGLNATKTAWVATTDVMVKGTDGARTRLSRTFNNYSIPIFQFGIFFDGDLEFHPGPNFSFGGRVHTNGDLYLAGGDQSKSLWLTFNGRVSSHGEIVTDRMRNGYKRPGNWNLDVKINDGSGGTKTLATAKGNVPGATTEGSVVGGPDLLTNDDDRYDGTPNPKWEAIASQFKGNLLARQQRLDLPLTRSSSKFNQGPIELIRRPRPGLPPVGDDDILTQSRYANKPCLRITLSDKQTQLPGGSGGVRLDGNSTGNTDSASGDADATAGKPYRGYQPLKRPLGVTPKNYPGAPLPPDPPAGSQATRLNGWRFSPVSGRHQWIKAEIVVPDKVTGAIATQDVTASLLSLGLTQFATINGTNYGDPNAVVELQRFAVEGPPLKVSKQSEVFSTTTTYDSVKSMTRAVEPAPPSPFVSRTAPVTGVGGGWLAYTYLGATPNGQSVVGAEINRLLGNTVEFNQAKDTWPQTTFATGPSPDTALKTIKDIHLVPVPIMLFDTREGLYYEDLDNTGWTNLYQNGSTTTSRVPVNGVMSTVNINMANFRRLVRGDFDGTMVGTLSSASFPVNDARGWIVYVSDRRNDIDDDGQYDMEDVFTGDPKVVGTENPGEDVNNSKSFEDSIGSINQDGTSNATTGLGEGALYATSIESDIAALQDTSFYRRTVRITNGQNVPGNDKIGFTLASENGVYVQGNFNASSVSTIIKTPADLSQPADYNSTSTATYPIPTGAPSTTIVRPPASIVADAITVLSNNWHDAQSFRYPFYPGSNTSGGRYGAETTVRAAFLMGNARSAALVFPGSESTTTPAQAGTKEGRLSGGVHNFKRFIETWGPRMNYCGSLINVFNSTNSNGTYKNGQSHTYAPPADRNWIFDSNFLDPEKLPPGTPFFQYLNFTGFRQTFVDTTK